MATKNPAPEAAVKKSGRNSGGQKGHPGSTLEAVADPDFVIEHRVLTCILCGRKLDPEPVSDDEARQVVDVEPVKPSVTEHCALIRTCPYCGHINKGGFPQGVTNDLFDTLFAKRCRSRFASGMT